MPRFLSLLKKWKEISINDFFNKCDQTAVSCGFGHICWIIPGWKTLFFVVFTFNFEYIQYNLQRNKLIFLFKFWKGICELEKTLKWSHSLLSTFNL